MQRKIDELQVRLNDKTIECAELRAKQRNGTIPGSSGEPTGEYRTLRAQTYDCTYYNTEHWISIQAYVPNSIVLVKVHSHVTS